MAQSDMETLNVDERELEDLRLDLAVYFCEDEKTFRLDECISIFNTFCQKFIKAIDVSLLISWMQFLKYHELPQGTDDLP